MPVSIDPNETYLFAGSDTPVSGQSIIGFNSDYTKKTTSIAQREREMAAREAQLEQESQQARNAMALMTAFDEDPFGTLTRVREGLVKSAMESGVDIPDDFKSQPANVNPANSTQPSMGKNPWDTDEGKGMMALLSDMQAELGGLRAQLAVKDEIAGVQEKYNQMKDPAFKAKLAEFLQGQPSTPLDAAIRAVSYEDSQAELEKARAEIKSLKRDNLFSAPELGFGTPSADSNTNPEDKWNAIVEGLVDQAAGV